jgi:hypothetical protein
MPHERVTVTSRGGDPHVEAVHRRTLADRHTCRSACCVNIGERVPGGHDRDIEAARPRFGHVRRDRRVCGRRRDQKFSIGFSAIGAPTFGITHVTILFTGDEGTFTLKAQIRRRLSDPNVLTDSGTWTIIAVRVPTPTHGNGTVTGTVDDNLNLITRTYAGEVHFD